VTSLYAKAPTGASGLAGFSGGALIRGSWIILGYLIIARAGISADSQALF